MSCTKNHITEIITIVIVDVVIILSILFSPSVLYIVPGEVTEGRFPVLVGSSSFDKQLTYNFNFKPILSLVILQASTSILGDIRMLPRIMRSEEQPRCRWCEISSGLAHPPQFPKKTVYYLAAYERN